MKLTYKAIARMAGYRVHYMGTYYMWIDIVGRDTDVSRHKTEDEAYKYCCLDNLLVEGEQQ